MSILLVRHHIESLKSLGVTNFTDENLSASQNKLITSNHNMADLVEKLKSDESLHKMKFKSIDQGIQIKAPMTWSSWGDKMTIKPIETNAEGFEFEIASKPFFNLQLVDYGKNLMNIMMIEKAIKSAA